MKSFCTKGFIKNKKMCRDYKLIKSIFGLEILLQVLFIDRLKLIKLKPALYFFVKKYLVTL